MTILFNLLGLAGYQGQEVFTQNVLRSIAKLLTKQTKILIAAPPYLNFNLPAKPNQISLCQLKPQFLFSKPFYNYTLNQLLLPIFLRHYQIDFIFSPTPLFPLFYGRKNIVTIHDCAYRRLKLKGNFLSEALLHFFTLCAKILAKKIITVSYFSKNELIKLYKIPANQIEVIYEAPPLLPKIKASEAQALIKKLGIQKPYFIHIGIPRPQKNIIRLLKSFKLFSATHRHYILVLAGKIDKRFIDVKKWIKKLNLSSKVKQTNFINNKEKVALLKNAKALVFPSIYEGFGLPILEAQSLKVPVITSNCTALPEITGKGALFVNPYKINEISQAMETIISDKKLVQKITKEALNNLKRFSWQKSAKKLLAIFIRKYENSSH